MRGRIHHAFLAEIAQLSAIETRKDPDGAGPLTSGYDDDFDEVVTLTKTEQRVSARQESPVVFLPCNIETTEFGALTQLMSGNSPKTQIQIVFHRRDLELRRLIVKETGECRIRENDRLVSVRDQCMNMVQLIRTPPGLYVTQVQPTFGIGTLPDLILMTFEERAQGVSG